MSRKRTPPAVSGRRPRASAWLGAGLCALGAFVIYAVTLAPSVGFIDAGELAAVAHDFGIAHPTGYPLFTLVAGLWAMLPLGSTIWRLNVLSALWSAGAVALLFMTAWTLLGPFEPTASTTRRSAASAFAALSVAFAATFWKTALGVEVYSLHMLLVALTLWLFARLLTHTESDGPPTRLLAAAALALGLAFSNHLTTIYLVPGLGLGYLLHFGWRKASWKGLLWAAPAFAAGLLPYLYLPLRAAQQPWLNWGNPSSWTRFWWHVSGKQYREWVFSGTEVAGRQLRYFLHQLPLEFAWVGLLLAPVGLFWLLRRRPRLGWVLVLLAAVCVLYSVNYDIHDIDSYFLLVHVCCGLWAGFGLYALLGSRRRWLRQCAFLLAGVSLVCMLAASGPRVSERGNFLVEDYTHNMFDSFAPGALVFSYQWDYWVSASYYYQRVEALRPDVVVIDKELLRRSHYLDQIRNNFPAVCRGSEPAFSALYEQLALFEHGLDYDPQRIEAAYNGLIQSLIDHNVLHRPVYLTLEIEPHLARGYVRVPEGLAFRLYLPGQRHTPQSEIRDDFRIRPFARDDVYVRGLMSAYPTMLTNRGIYLARSGQPAAAVHYFERALAMDPQFELAAGWLARLGRSP